MTDAPEEAGGTVWDAPNQQAVRPDMSGPWMEGEGGSGPPGSTDPQTAAEETSELDEMTKDQLLEYAQQLGISPANASMTKDELRTAIDAQQARG